MYNNERLQFSSTLTTNIFLKLPNARTESNPQQINNRYHHDAIKLKINKN